MLDPGAVPGTSTIFLKLPFYPKPAFLGGETGLTIYSKGRYAVFGEIPPLSVQKQMNANDNNVAPVAMAA